MSVTIKDNRVEFDRILDENIDDFLHVVGNFLAGEAELRCAVDTGNLAGSVSYATSDYKSSVRPSNRTIGQHSGKLRTYTISQVDAVSQPVAKNTVYIGTSVDYAGDVELGTVNSAAQPFIVPALTENIGRVNRLAIETITK